MANRKATDEELLEDIEQYEEGLTMEETDPTRQPPVGEPPSVEGTSVLMDPDAFDFSFEYNFFFGEQATDGHIKRHVKVIAPAGIDAAGIEDAIRFVQALDLGLFPPVESAPPAPAQQQEQPRPAPVAAVSSVPVCDHCASTTGGVGDVEALKPTEERFPSYACRTCGYKAWVNDGVVGVFKAPRPPRR